MIRKSSLVALAAVVSLWAGAGIAHDGIHVNDPYARVSTAMSVSGAAFMIIENHKQNADRLIDARSDISERVELHTHAEDSQGVMRMIHVEEGFEIPAGGEVRLERGGKHVMFLGLRRPLEQGATVNVTLVFESGEEIALEIPVDNDRQVVHGEGAGQMQQDQGGGHMHGHGHGHRHGN